MGTTEKLCSHFYSINLADPEFITTLRQADDGMAGWVSASALSIYFQSLLEEPRLCNVSIFIQFMLARPYDNSPGRECVGLLAKPQRPGEFGLGGNGNGAGG